MRYSLPRSKSHVPVSALLIIIVSASLIGPVDSIALAEADDEIRSPESFYLDPLMSELYNVDYSAFCEVAIPSQARNNYWFWATDNAKILLLMLRDYENYKDEADEIASLVESLYYGPFFSKKKADMSLLVLDERPENFKISNNQIMLYGDLASERVFIEYEGRPLRSQPALALLSGAYVYFNGEHYSVRHYITTTSVETQSDKAILTVNFRDPHGIHGSLRYIMRSHLPFVDVEFNVGNDGIHPVQDVINALLFDQMSNFSTFTHFYSPATGEIPFESSPEVHQIFASPLGADTWWMIYRKFSLYESEGLWMYSPDSGRDLTIRNRWGAGRAYQLALEYKGPSHLGPGESLTITQRILPVLGVNWVDIEKYDFRKYDLTGIDPGYDRDWGLNTYALAEYFRKTGKKGELVSEMIRDFHRIATEGPVNSRSIGFHIEACLTMYEATGCPSYIGMARDLADTILARYIGFNPDGEMIASLHVGGRGGYTDVQAEVAKALYQVYLATGNDTYLTYADHLFDAFRIDENGSVFVRQICGFDCPGEFLFHDGTVLDAGLVVRPNGPVTMRSLSQILCMTHENFTIPTTIVNGTLNSETHPYAALAVLRYGDYLERLIGARAVFKRLISANITSIVPDAHAMSLSVDLEGSGTEAIVEYFCPDVPPCFVLNSRSLSYDPATGFIRLETDIPINLAISFNSLIPLRLIGSTGTIKKVQWIPVRNGRPPAFELVAEGLSDLVLQSPVYTPLEVLMNGAKCSDWTFNPMTKLLEIELKSCSSIIHVLFSGYYLTIKSKDPFGKVLPFANIELYDSSKHLILNTTTNEVGELTLFLAPDSYTICSHREDAHGRAEVNLSRNVIVALELRVVQKTPIPPSIPPSIPQIPEGGLVVLPPIIIPNLTLASAVSQDLIVGMMVVGIVVLIYVGIKAHIRKLLKWFWSA